MITVPARRRGPEPSRRRLRTAACVLALLLPAVPAPAQQPGAGDVSGRVVGADTGRPVEAVGVTLVDLDRRTVTSGEGRFLFGDVPAGTHTLRVRHLGFASEEREIEVRDGLDLSLTVRLTPEPVELEPLVAGVESEIRVPRLEQRGYYERRELGFGDFLGPRYLTGWSLLRVPDVLQRVAGAELQRRGGHGRTIRAVFPDGCAATFYVDGVPWGETAPDFPVTEVAAIEVYEHEGEARLAGVVHVGCGLVYIWTWSGPNPFRSLDLNDAECPLPEVRSRAC